MLNKEEIRSLFLATEAAKGSDPVIMVNKSFLHELCADWLQLKAKAELLDEEFGPITPEEIEALFNINAETLTYRD